MACAAIIHGFIDGMHGILPRAKHAASDDQRDLLDLPVGLERLKTDTNLAAAKAGKILPDAGPV